MKATEQSLTNISKHVRLTHIKRAVDDVVLELEHAINKYGPEMPTVHHGYTVVLLELNEVLQELQKKDTKAAVQEMKQVAAVALKFIANFDQHG